MGFHRAPGKIIFAAAGSGGDVYPLLAIAGVLKTRGHQVHFIANAYFECAARAAGLEFHGIGCAGDYWKFFENPEFWSGLKGVKLGADELLKSLPAAYRIIQEVHEPGRTLVVLPMKAVWLHFVCEKLSAPWVGLHVTIETLRSYNDVSRLAWPDWCTTAFRPVRKVLRQALMRRILRPWLLPELNRLRSGLGLPPLAELDGWRSHTRALQVGLFPDWFLPRQPDWPDNTKLAGFPLADRAQIQEIPEEARRFLDAGEPPLVFVFGSAMRIPAAVAEETRKACELLGRRGMLLGPRPQGLEERTDGPLRHFDFVPLSLLLPRAYALIHHGGIGTMSQALAAGIPQLVAPLSFDQPLNAAHLRRLAAGASIRWRNYRAPLVARKVEALVQSVEIAQQRRALKKKIADNDGVADACRLIEMAVPAR